MGHQKPGNGRSWVPPGHSAPEGQGKQSSPVPQTHSNPLPFTRGWDPFITVHNSGGANKGSVHLSMMRIPAPMGVRAMEETRSWERERPTKEAPWARGMLGLSSSVANCADQCVVGSRGGYTAGRGRYLVVFW